MASLIKSEWQYQVEALMSGKRRKGRAKGKYFNNTASLAKDSRLQLFLLNRLKKTSLNFQGLLVYPHEKPPRLHSRQKAVSIGPCLNIVAAPQSNAELH